MTKKKKIQHELQHSAQQIWLAGLGALSVAEKEGTKMFKSLVKKGEKYEVPGSKTVEQGVDAVKETVKKAQSKAEGEIDKQIGRVESSWDKVETRIDDTVATTLQKMGVPSRDEVKTLTLRVEQLTKKVEALKPATTRKKSSSKVKTKTRAKAKTQSKAKATKRRTTKTRTRKAS